VARARAGDRDALDVLLRRHYDRIFGLCRRMTGNDADAADAAQEALVALVRGLPRFDGRSTFATWAYRVATNACLDELRRRQRRPDPSETGTDGEVAPEAGEPGVADAVSDRLDIDAALGRLPVDFRTVVVLRDQLGMDYAAIAETLDIPVGTVRSRLARGRGALSDLLGNRRSRPTVQEHAP
jgi:RNA polymerase sigma-70 factor (ECF subfamily)